jgi:hypothetical protein
MQFVNLTPHTIVVYKDDKPVLEIPASGQEARVQVLTERIGEANGVELFVSRPGPVTGLPRPQNDVIYIVSMAVRLALPEATDLASPGELVRNSAGQPIGCRGLIVNG